MKNAELEREATRFIAIRATKNGNPVVAQQYAVTAYNIRPDAIPDAAWQNVVTKGSDVGFYQPAQLTSGDYIVWAKWVDALETPVEEAGRLVIS